MLQAVLNACHRPVYVDPASIARKDLSAPVDKVAVFAEKHRPDDSGTVHGHMHVAIHASAKFRFLPVKRALRLQSGLASHWSCTHGDYWSALRYCWVPSPKKPAASLDKYPELWGRDAPVSAKASSS